MTNEQRAAWLEGRRTGIGGSDVAAVLGLNPWKTPLDVWNDKLGLSEDKGMSEPAYWGTVLEDTVAKEFQLRTGKRVQKVSHQFADPETPWAIANIDRAIINPEIAGKVRPLLKVEEIERYADITGVERIINTDVAFEAKTANAFTADLWGPSQELEIKQNNLRTEHVIPLYYETQIQWYCGILKLKGMYLAVLIGGSDFRMYWVLGYIVGLKYASIICAGSLAVWWIIIPGMSLIWGDSVLNQWNPEITATVGAMSPEEIFKYYAKSIGIGGIAMAGIIGIIKSWGIIKSAVGLAAKEMGGKADAETNVKRTQRDLSMKIIAIGSIVTLILVTLFFYFDVMQGNLMHTVVAILLVAGISFLFTTVAANAIAIVGTNPVSGMTLMTLILASVVMVAVGLKGPGGMVAALVMGGVVCTALSMAGGFITDLKIGYWLGSTPVKQETWKFLGTIVSAATVGGVMIILNKTYGFTSGQLAAPQANAMAAVIEPLMNGVGAPWLLYGIGAVLAIVLNACKIPALAFALGMFIPLELNVPLVVGGAVNWYVTSRSKDATLNAERGEKGTLLASGFIAGGALMGVVSAAMRFGGVNMVNDAWLSNTWSEVLALGAYAILIFYLVKASMKTK